MKLGILSDVHADACALRDALRHLDALGCDEIVCLGDVVDYGAWPNATVQLLSARRIATVRGNHDRWALARVDPTASYLPDDEVRRYLEALPTKLALRRGDVRIALHHASPRGDMDGIDPAALRFDEAARLLERAECDVLLVGHTHHAFALQVPGRGVIANPGALLRDPGKRSDDAPLASGSFGVLELPALGFTVHDATTGDEIACQRLSAGWAP